MTTFKLINEQAKTLHESIRQVAVLERDLDTFYRWKKAQPLSIFDDLTVARQQVSTQTNQLLDTILKKKK